MSKLDASLEINSSSGEDMTESVLKLVSEVVRDLPGREKRADIPESEGDEARVQRMVVRYSRGGGRLGFRGWWVGIAAGGGGVG